MMLQSQITPAHPQPIPRILAKPQFPYTAMIVATLKNQSENKQLDHLCYVQENLIIKQKLDFPITHQLCYKKSNHKQETRAFNIRPASRPSNKDQCLTYNTHLKIDSCCKLVIVVPDRSYTKLILPIYLGIIKFAIGLISRREQQ